MSLTIASIKDLKLTGSVLLESVSPLQPSIPINIPINCANVRNLNRVEGTFTPENNSKTIVSGLTAKSPNFILLYVDAPAVVAFDNSFVTSGAPIAKMLFMAMAPIQGGANPIDSIQLVGTTGAPYPMAQGVAVNYELIYGQADIS